MNFDPKRRAATRLPLTITAVCLVLALPLSAQPESKKEEARTLVWAGA